MDDELMAVQQALHAAHEHVRCAERVERFVAGLSGVPDAADIAEYAALLRQEEAARAQRTEALRRAGFVTPSVTR